MFLPIFLPDDLRGCNDGFRSSESDDLGSSHLFPRNDGFVIAGGFYFFVILFLRGCNDGFVITPYAPLVFFHVLSVIPGSKSGHTPFQVRTIFAPHPGVALIPQFSSRSRSGHTPQVLIPPRRSIVPSVTMLGEACLSTHRRKLRCAEE